MTRAGGTGLGTNARGRAQGAEAEAPKPWSKHDERWRDWVGHERKRASAESRGGGAEATEQA